MKGGFFRSPASLGFTIVEVMVFLAVSGFTFLIAASFINGKESQAEYRTGMIQANLQVQTIINNVANGNYALPAGNSLKCSLSANGPVVSNAPPVLNQVAILGCTFIGSVISPSYNSNPQLYYTYTVAGCQYYAYRLGSYQCSNSTADLTPMNLEEEQPQVVDKLSGPSSWQGGIGLTKMFMVSGKNWDQITALGFFGSFPSLNNGVMESGAEPVALVYFNGNSAKTDQDIASLGTKDATGQLLTSGYIVMCFTGSNGQYGAVEIGSSNGGLQLASTAILGQKVPSQCQS